MECERIDVESIAAFSQYNRGSYPGLWSGRLVKTTINGVRYLVTMPIYCKEVDVPVTVTCNDGVYVVVDKESI